MLAAIVTAAAVSAAPTPYDLLTAHADLQSPPGTPALTVRSPRMRLALLVAMVAADVLDRDAPDHRWFAAGLAWETELDYARGLVARVRTCPQLGGDWLPPAAWFRERAAYTNAVAAAWRRRAEEYRGRIEWEIDREEALAEWARRFEGEADRLAAEAGLYAGWAGGLWNRPRRVVLAEVRDWLGAEAWEKREWPGE